MKINFKLFLALIPAMIVFCGCPVGTTYSLGIPGTEKIDEKLIGTWTNSTPEHELVKVKISRKDDHTYVVKVLEKGEMYAIEDEELNAWVTTVGNRTFVYAQGSSSDDFYLYGYEITGKNTMESYGVSLKGKGLDEIKSDDEYRKEIKESLEKEGAIGEKAKWTKE